ncbi:hypothetical protein MMPV_001206 [Pyropia vietnamensis]
MVSGAVFGGLVLWVASTFIAGAATTPPSAASLHLPPRAPPGDAAAGAVLSSTRVTINAYPVCRSGVVLRRSGVTCPCYFHWMISTLSVGPSFNVTLSSTNQAADHAASTAAAAAADALSAHAVRPATPLRLASGLTIFAARGDSAVFSHSVNVDLVITANISAVDLGGRVCPARVLLVLEPVEPTCPLRDIRLGGDGEVLGSEKGLPSRRLAVGPITSMGPPDRPVGPHSESFVDTIRLVSGSAPGEARPSRTELNAAIHGASPPLKDLIQSRLWAKAPPEAPPPSVRVVGGTRLADPLARSFVVFLRGPGRACTGCLIAPRVVLTVAHCGVTPGFQVATLPAKPHPSPKTAAAAAAMRNVTVKRVVRHPDYSSTRLTADLAVVFLTTDAPGYPSQLGRGGGTTPSSAIRPAAVNHDPAVPAAGSGVRVAGFGRRSQGWPTAHPDERSVDIRVVPSATCRQQLSGWRLGNDNYSDILRPAIHLCAGLDGGGCDSCHGDSGGPLYQSAATPDGRRLFILVGLTSFSSGCAGPRQPTVYTRLSAYAGWIDGLVGGAGTAPPPGTTGGARATGATPAGTGEGSGQSSSRDGGGGHTLAAALGASVGLAAAVVAVVSGVVVVRRRRRAITEGMLTAADAAGDGTPTVAAAGGSLPQLQPPPPIARGASGAVDPAGAEEEECLA